MIGAFSKSEVTMKFIKRYLRNIKIEIVTTWYNEQFLIPLFLRHYYWADRINIILDKDSNDSTERLISDLQRHLSLNLRIIPFRFPDGFDAGLKMNITNEVVSSLSAEWVCVLDADEFIWAEGFVDPHKILANIQEDVVYGNMWDVYRHSSDDDINADIEIIKGNEIVNQRRHGDPAISHYYSKPVFARSSAKAQWGLGNHSIATTTGSISPITFKGTHWANADPCFCIERRVKNRKFRFSERQLAEGWGIQNHSITEEEIQNLCKEHLNDPALW